MEGPAQQPKKNSSVPVLVTISLQTLLWSSLVALSIQIYFLIVSAIDPSLFLADIFCVAAAGTSLLTIVTHILVVRLREDVFSKWACSAVPFVKTICLFFSCTAVLLWIATCGLSIILSLARQPTCRPASSNAPEMWRKGRICILQRSALVASMLALIVSFVLCLVQNIASDPFTAGLFGSTQEDVCLSPSDFQRTPQMVKRQSTLSFKCRSATSLIFVSSPLRQEMKFDEDKPMGLGISTNRSSIDKAPLLSKSPSNSSTSSGSTVEELPHPPLPAYMPPTQASNLYPLKRVPTTYLAPPPAVAFRRLKSQRQRQHQHQRVSFASISSSVYSRNTNDE